MNYLFGKKQSCLVLPTDSQNVNDEIYDDSIKISIIRIFER